MSDYVSECVDKGESVFCKHGAEAGAKIPLFAVFQCDQQSSRSEAGGRDADVFAKAHWQHCGHLLCLLHYLWNTGSAGKLWELRAQKKKISKIAKWFSTIDLFRKYSISICWWLFHQWKTECQLLDQSKLNAVTWFSLCYIRSFKLFFLPLWLKDMHIRGWLYSTSGPQTCPGLTPVCGSFGTRLYRKPLLEGALFGMTYKSLSNEAKWTKPRAQRQNCIKAQIKIIKKQWNPSFWNGISLEKIGVFSVLYLEETKKRSSPSPHSIMVGPA